MDYTHNIKKRCLYLILTVLAFTLSSACQKSPNNSSLETFQFNAEEDKTDNIQNVSFTGAQIIDDKNRALIGKEFSSDITPEITNRGDLSTNDNPQTDIKWEDIPGNNIIKDADSDCMLPPAFLQQFSVKNSTTPEIIFTNGTLVIFTKENGEGWSCKAGNKITFKYDKYPSEVTSEQAMEIGYIKDGILYSGEVYRDLSGTYQLPIQEDGEYYIFLLNASSDYLALYEGSIVCK